MDQLLLTLSIVALFLVRLGIPVILLISIGVVIDRWQSKREQRTQQTSHKHA
jgi:hypothetical protein